MDLKGSRVLVTGGAGLIGSHIIDRLIREEAKEIIAFDKNLSAFAENRSPELDYGKVKLLNGDITRSEEMKEALKGVDLVVHTASLLTREAADDLQAGFGVNVHGTFNLLEGCVASRVKKFVYSSSISIYGDPVTDPITEEHPFNITSLYGAGKVTSEVFLKFFEKAKGLDYVALLYAVVYGPRQHYRGNLVQYIPECFDRIERGLPPIIYGDGSQPYDYIFVEDVARANVIALKSPVTGEAFNVGTGVTTTVKDVVGIIIEVAGISQEPEYAPRGDRFGLKSLYLDVTKAEKILGFKAEVSLKEGLRRYFEWRKRRPVGKG
jgi:UDP-glucose 4-epimerase